MRLGKAIAIAAPIAAGGAALAAYASYRLAMAEAGSAYDRLLSHAAATSARYDPDMVADQPEIARRYFAHAIARGTPLASLVELEMKGTFLLGDKSSHQSYAMTARQVLRPPFEFVWMPILRSGAIQVSGSDALVDGRAWTRFWLAGLFPVANERTSPDMLRSAAFRAASESVWLPASLLPQRGAKWEQTAADRARVMLPSASGPIVLDLTIEPNGALKELAGVRWSNANPQKEFRLQSFGGTVVGERTFGGFTIPARLTVGNHYGTREYLPFFQTELVAATYR